MEIKISLKDLIESLENHERCDCSRKAFNRLTPEEQKAVKHFIWCKWAEAEQDRINFAQKIASLSSLTIPQVLTWNESEEKKY